jgi:hypothetical protein
LFLVALEVVDVLLVVLYAEVDEAVEDEALGRPPGGLE